MPLTQRELNRRTFISQPSMMTAAGGCILALLFCAPLLHGGATDAAIFWLEIVAYLAGVLWIAELIITRRRPHIPLVLVIPAAWLLFQGWAMAFNAKGVFDSDFMAFAPLDAWESLPGASDGPAARAIMIRMAALFTVLLVTCDLAQSTRWLRRFINCMALSGIATALIGLWQKSSQNSLDIWSSEGVPDTVFGTYWYHGNAASLLNMAWPLVLGRVIWSFQNDGRHVEKALWTVSLGAIFAGLLVNVSKAGHLLAGVLALILVLLLLLHLKPLIAEVGWKLVLAYTTLAVLAMAAVFVTVDPIRSITRWDLWLSQSGGDSRLETARVVLGMLPEAGWLGFGPGSFLSVFNEHMVVTGARPLALWKFAHNDPLQYVFEWGYIGGAAWAVLWLAPATRVAGHFYSTCRSALGLEAKRNRRSRQRWSRSYEALRQNLLRSVSLAFIGVLIHACMDFPLQIMSLQIWAFAFAAVLVCSPKHDVPEFSHGIDATSRG